MAVIFCSGREVDFVIYGPDGFAAIEVKASKRVEGKDVRALRAFQDDYPEARVLLLYGGSQRLQVNGVLCLPCEGFLRDLCPGAALPS